LSSKQHTSREFDAELQALKNALLGMGGRVEQNLERVISALMNRDSELARQAIEFDREIDRTEMEIDELSLKILALRQPVGSDLRFLTTAFKIVTDLERVGDLCVNTAERVLELNMEPQLKPYIDLPKMAAQVSAVLRQALDAYVSGDVEKAGEVLAAEQSVDDLNVQIFRELVSFMVEDPRTITRAMRLIFIAKYLERIADHATNIAEQVIFMVKGSDVRHGVLSRGTPES
jgi:phosphate transport system protein